MAVSASAVEESTFIWNPNLIALSSSGRACRRVARLVGGDGEARPLAWVVAFAGAIVTMHCHVLGSVLAPAIVVPWILDVRRREGPERRRLLVGRRRRPRAALRQLRAAADPRADRRTSPRSERRSPSSRAAASRRRWRSRSGSSSSGFASWRGR